MRRGDMLLHWCAVGRRETRQKPSRQRGARAPPAAGDGRRPGAAAARAAARSRCRPLRLALWRHEVIASLLGLESAPSRRQRLGGAAGSGYRGSRGAGRRLLRGAWRGASHGVLPRGLLRLLLGERQRRWRSMAWREDREGGWECGIVVAARGGAVRRRWGGKRQARRGCTTAADANRRGRTLIKNAPC